MKWNFSSAPENAEPIPVSPMPPTHEEFKEAFEPVAGEINYLMEQIFDACDSGDPASLGRELGKFSSYMFHLGRDYEKGQ